MAIVKMYINREVAMMCGCNAKTVQQYAQKPENEINFAGDGRRKIYIWFADDIERFKSRDVTLGRPKMDAKKPADRQHEVK